MKTITIKHPRSTYKISVNKTYKIYRGNTMLGKVTATDWLAADNRASDMFPNALVHVREVR